MVLQSSDDPMNRRRSCSGISASAQAPRRLMRVPVSAGMAPGPNTSEPHPRHKTYPNLLRGLAVVEPNQVWSADIGCSRLEQSSTGTRVGCCLGASPTVWRRRSAWTAALPDRGRHGGPRHGSAGIEGGADGDRWQRKQDCGDPGRPVGGAVQVRVDRLRGRLSNRDFSPHGCSLVAHWLLKRKRLRQKSPKPLFYWSRREDSNPRPADYKSAALPTELRRRLAGVRGALALRGV